MLGIAIGTLLLWLQQKKYMRIFFIIVFIVPVVLVIDYFTIGIISNLFVSVADNFTQTTGTWKPRVEQLEFAYNLIMEYPILGAGVEALREVQSRMDSQILALFKYKADLGYVSFVKAYGILGGIWLLLFYTYTLKKLFKLQKIAKEYSLFVRFCLGYLLYVMISFITINHFMYPQEVTCLMLVLTIIEIIERDEKLKLLKSK